MHDSESFREDFERWAAVFEHAGWGIVVGAADGRTIETCNPAFARARGYTVNELRGRAIVELYPLHQREAAASRIAKLDYDRSPTFESEHLRKDGSIFPVRINVSTILGPDGQTKNRVAHVQDLTEEHQQAADLRAASLTRDVLDRLIEGCQVLSFDYRYLYLNDLAVRHARKPREALLGRTMQACYPGIEQAPMFALLRKAMTERTCGSTELEFPYPDGSKRQFALRFVPVEQGLCVLSLDVTEQRSQLAAIVNDSHDAIVSCTLDGTLTSWNKGAEHLLGFTADEMIGHSVARIMESKATVQQNSLRITAKERIVAQPARRLHKDGHVVELSLTQSPMHDQQGNIIGVSTIARDVTALNRAQHALVEAKARTDEANRELEAFSSSVAHDLRAPLRSIDGFSQALLEDCAPLLDEKGTKYLSYVRESAQLMSRLIDDLLQLSRVSRHELTRQTTDLSALASRRVATLRRTHPARVVDVTIAPDLVVQGDPVLLGTAIDNLIDNAWKFSSKRPHAQLTFGAVTRDGRLTYFVRDDGAGFDQAYAHKLFGAFQRLHSTVEFEGSGIGLATVARVVHRHFGRVWAEGQVGVGATFWFTLNEEER